MLCNFVTYKWCISDQRKSIVRLHCKSHLYLFYLSLNQRLLLKKPTKDLNQMPLDYFKVCVVTIPVIDSFNIDNFIFFFLILTILLISWLPYLGIINKVSLGDLSSGRAFDNGCTCFDSCQGVVNDLRGQKTDCVCSVSCNLCFFFILFFFILFF